MKAPKSLLIELFAHGSGSGRHSPRNNFVAETLSSAGIGPLLMDLLTHQEDAVYRNRFEVDLLTWRSERATHLFEEPGTMREVACLASEWLCRHFEDRRARNQTPMHERRSHPEP